MQRRRVVKAANNNLDDGTARKLNKKPSEANVEEAGNVPNPKKKTGVLRKLGFMLHPDRQDLGSTLKKRKPKRATERKRRQAAWNPDKKVHFNIEKAHSNIPLKGDMITDIQKKVFHKFTAEAVKKSPPEYATEFTTKIKSYVGHPMERKIFDSNPTKNRYKDVVCNDVTRVVLSDGYDGDYIHANNVNGLNAPFILTQGPTAATIIDFWRMVVHTRSSYIVMLCEVMEDGKPKCAQYWPEKVGEVTSCGMWVITCTSEDDKDQNIIKRTLSVKNTDSGKEHILKHLHTKSWPDKSVPNSTLFLLRMLYIVRTSPGPVIVHCSAGIGRTGTFVAVEACLQILTDGKELDLLGAVKALRNSRAGSVQVDIQYMTLVQILINYGKDNGYWEDADLDDRVELLTWNIQQFIQSRGKVDHLLATPSTPNLAAAPPPPPPAPVAPVAVVAPTAPPAPAACSAPPPVFFAAPAVSPVAPVSPVIPTTAPVVPVQVPAPPPPPKAPVVKEAPPQKKPVYQAPVSIHHNNGLVTKDSTEDAEEAENEPKLQGTQKTDQQHSDDLATVIPMAPVLQTTSPILTTPPSPPKKKKSRETPKTMQIQSKEQLARKSSEKVTSKEKFKELRKDRSQYFM